MVAASKFGPTLNTKTQAPMPSRPHAGFARRIARLARELGVPADYAVARRLAPQREASRLVTVGRAPDDRKVVRLAPRAAVAWRAMSRAAADDGIVLLAMSGFRSVTRQTQIIRLKLAAGQSLASILRLVAAPGFSEHHTGCALDLSSSPDTGLEVDFAQTAAYRWLRRRAHEFGFHLSFPRGNPHGIGYEPWHWRWRK